MRRAIASVSSEEHAMVLVGNGFHARVVEAVTAYVLHRIAWQPGQVCRVATAFAGAGGFLVAAETLLGSDCRVVFAADLWCVAARALSCAGWDTKIYGSATAGLDGMVALGQVDIWQGSVECKGGSAARRGCEARGEGSASIRAAALQLDRALEYVRATSPRAVILECTVDWVCGDSIAVEVREVLPQTYWWAFQVVSPEDCGVPVARKRVWIVGLFDGGGGQGHV